MQQDEIEFWLRDRIAAEVGLAREQVSCQAPLIGYFMNGFQSFKVVAELEAVVGRHLPDSVLYSRPTIAELAEHLCAAVQFDALAT